MSTTLDRFRDARCPVEAGARQYDGRRPDRLLWDRDLKAEVDRELEFKGLQADPLGVFVVIRNMSTQHKIIEEERSRERRE